MPTLNVFVKDPNGQPVAGARVAIITKNASILPATRYTQGDGGCNLYYQGPEFHPPLEVDVMVDAAGYVPFCTATTPILFGTQDIDYAVTLQSFKQPFTPAPHAWTGQFCGTRVPNLPPVDGYSPSAPDLVMSWFYPFYAPSVRADIRTSWLPKYPDQIASWPDCRARGFTPEMFVASCKEWIANGIRPCVMLTSKDFDLSSDSPNGADVPAIIAALQPVVKLLVGVIPRVCVGWELNLWLSPTQVQELTDALMPPFVAAGCRTYVHFWDYMSFPQPDCDNASYWNMQVGKLTGVLHERAQERDPDIPKYLDHINDCLERFAGNDGMPAQNGIDGLPFDFVAFEITAIEQYAGAMSEAQGDVWGQAAVNAPPRSGPAGLVGVMGSGNGF